MYKEKYGNEFCVSGTLDLTDPEYNEDLTECDIVLYDDDDSIAHFHIISLHSDFESCVCVFEPRYYNKHEDCRNTLTLNQKIKLNEWFKIVDTSGYFIKNYTFWEKCKYFIRRHNENINFLNYANAIQPDYTLLKEE